MLKTVWHPKTGVYFHSSGGHWNWAFGGQKYPSVETTFFQTAKGEKEEPPAIHWKKEIGLHLCSALNSSPNQTNQCIHPVRGKTAMNSHLSQVCDWLQNTAISHPNKHFKSKSKAIKTLLTLSLLPQANHKLPEFTTFAGREGERCWVLKPNLLACFLYCFSFSSLSPFGTVIN